MFVNNVKTPNYSTTNDDINIILDSIRRNINSPNKDPENDTFQIDIKSSNTPIDWNEDIEQEILKLSQCCKQDSIDIYNKYIIISKYNKLCNMGTCLCNLVSICIAASSIDTTYKIPIVIACNSTNIVIKGIQSFYNLLKYKYIYKQSSTELGDLSLKLKYEVYKPIKERKNIHDFVFDIQFERETLLNKILS